MKRDCHVTPDSEPAGPAVFITPFPYVAVLPEPITAGLQKHIKKLTTEVNVFKDKV
mgnify:CR=1 FL=1